MALTLEWEQRRRVASDTRHKPQTLRDVTFLFLLSLFLSSLFLSVELCVDLALLHSCISVSFASRTVAHT